MLMREVAASVGHDDWGSRSFVEPLTLLVDSCRASNRMSLVGWQVLRSVARRHLRNRLDIRGYLQRRPEAAQRPLGSPLVITGLPRTGTSLLHNLLAQDPRHRFLRLWEALHPLPPDNGHGLDEATLVHKAEQWLGRLFELAPDFATVHPLAPHGPEECDRLLQNAFASQHFMDMFDAPAYADWFCRCSLEDAYADYALQLRVLTREEDADRRWVLKSPGHMGHLDALLTTMPDAVVLHCHRDPGEAVPSYASLIDTVRHPHTDEVSPLEVGTQALQRCETALSRALETRAATAGRTFVDVSYPSLVADPVATVADVYQRLGLSLEPAVEGQMRRWLTENPRDQGGRHRYDPERFGLPPERVRAAFTDYRERYASLLEERL